MFQVQHKVSIATTKISFSKLTECSHPIYSFTTPEDRSTNPAPFQQVAEPLLPPQYYRSREFT